MGKKKSELSYKQILTLIVIAILLYTAASNYMALFGFIFMFIDILTPFILGAALAFVVIVPMRFVERHLAPNNRKFDKYRRGVAYLITLVLIVLVLTLALVVVIPEVAKAVKQVIAVMPGAFSDFENWVNDMVKKYPLLQNFSNTLMIDTEAIKKAAISFVREHGASFVSSGTGVISAVAGSVTNGVIAFIFSIYLVLQKERLASQAKQIMYGWFKEETADRAVYIARLSNRIFSNFISGQCIEACILGMMFFVTLSIFKMPYALLIGVVIAVTALIPIFGGIIGMAVGAFLILMVDPMLALYYLIISVVLQQIEGNLIYPHVVGGSIGLPSLWVLFAVTAGASIFGVGGILVFIPLCSVMYALFREATKGKLRLVDVPEEKYKMISADESDAIIDAIENEVYHKQPKSDDEGDENDEDLDYVDDEKDI
ncbi:MAG: AI-2E family transporter [Lachnospiraceae bacterium]|nr:AI-2E family transporter [Lachnospiraceae bacterium]